MKISSFEAVDGGRLRELDGYHTPDFHGPELAVIVPTFNERDNVEHLVNALDKALTGIAWEAVFVDDWSQDGTVDIVAKIARTRPDIRLHRRFGRRGLSSAVIEGMLATTAPIVAVIDGDLQHDETILPTLCASLRDGECDIAIGTRYAPGGSTGQWGAGRLRISGFATWLSQRFMPTTISDPMSGYFALHQSTLVALLPRLSNLGFKLLLDILISSPQPLRAREIPYHFRTRRAGESKLDAMVAVEFGLLLLDKLVGRWVPPRLILFAAVGGSGLAIHLAVLRLMLALGEAFDGAQAVAVTVAICFNFVLNNLLTFRDRRLRGAELVRGILSFYLVCGVGALANVGLGSAVYASHYSWWLAGIAGAAVGSIWNYLASSKLTWRGH